jgi:hypothetical protein
VDYLVSFLILLDRIVVIHQVNTPVTTAKTSLDKMSKYGEDRNDVPVAVAVAKAL